MEEKKRFYIALSRQFGSGGAETASKLAVKLGIKCYDKTLAEMTSVVTGYDKHIVLSAEDRATNAFWYNGFLGGESLSLYDKVFIGQSNVIKKLADKTRACSSGVALSRFSRITTTLSACLFARLCRRESRGYPQVTA